MPHSNDIDENVCTDDQLLLMDLLYGELDPDAEQGARRAIEGDTGLRDELAEFEALRGFMRELPDEEPPASLTAKLMHAAAGGVVEPKAAAAAADVAATGGGFFAWIKRLFEPMMMHPGLAAAASLVLVAGIAGAMYLGGKQKIAQPDAVRSSAVNESAPAASAPAAPTATPDKAEGDKAVAPAEPSMADDIPADVTTDTKALDEGRLQAGKAGAKADMASGEGKRSARGDMAGGLLKKETSAAKPSATERPQIRARSRNTASGKDANRYEVTTPGFGGAPKADPAPPRTRSKPAPARPEPAPARGPSAPAPDVDSSDDAAGAPAPSQRPQPKKPTSVRGSSGSTISAEPPPPPALKSADEEKPAPKKKLSPVQTLHREARALAVKGECKKVVAIAARVRKIDARYYDTEFLGDFAIRGCLQSQSRSKTGK